MRANALFPEHVLEQVLPMRLLYSEDCTEGGVFQAQAPTVREPDWPPNSNRLRGIRIFLTVRWEIATKNASRWTIAGIFRTHLRGLPCNMTPSLPLVCDPPAGTLTAAAHRSPASLPSQLSDGALLRVRVLAAVTTVAPAPKLYPSLRTSAAAT